MNIKYNFRTFTFHIFILTFYKNGQLFKIKMNFWRGFSKIPQKTPLGFLDFIITYTLLYVVLTPHLRLAAVQPSTSILSSLPHFKNGRIFNIVKMLLPIIDEFDRVSRPNRLRYKHAFGVILKLKEFCVISSFHTT